MDIWPIYLPRDPRDRKMPPGERYGLIVLLLVLATFIVFITVNGA